MVRRIFFLGSAGALVVTLGAAWFWPAALWGFAALGPLIAVGIWDLTQRSHSLRRNYPIIGHGRYLFEALRPEIQQYFVESNLDGVPFSRQIRSVIYQRAKSDLATIPFGTQQRVYETGYEWCAHTMTPAPHLSEPPRVLIGEHTCRKPYSCSVFNISAMSYGALSHTAIEALNKGAQLGGFAHNTGEGGVSEYHRKNGGDLIWQIGTGYFGCRTADGGFDEIKFAQVANDDQIKMVEVKISQGAKPSHGGILPGVKVSEEIARIRGVEVGKDVISPPTHKTFDTPIGLLQFLARLREASGCKPVGFKICIGRPEEFMAIAKAMIETGLHPDFITVDGAEGGTGAAPLEFTNSVGMPLREGLLFVHNVLVGCGLRSRIKIIAAGKIATAFQMYRAMALGADICNSARGMMFAIGCIQSLRCNKNDCPVGVATQDRALASALDVSSKAVRVFRYHQETIKAFMELLSATGKSSPSEITASDIFRRVSASSIKRFDEIYEFIAPQSLLSGSAPKALQNCWDCADPGSFGPKNQTLLSA